MSYVEPDCDICKHYESLKCSDCIYSEDEREDYFEPMSKEEIAQQEEQARQRSISAAINENIECEITDEFRLAFEAARKCSAEDHFKRVFMGVYATKEETLVASDTHMLLELKCDCIPDDLIGKVIIRLDEHQAGIHTEEAFPDYKNLFNLCMEYPSASLKDASFQPYSKPSTYFTGFDVTTLCAILGGQAFVVNESFLNAILSALKGDISVGYCPIDNLAPLRFIGDNGRALLVPVRTE